jgi:hypothetical protein
MSLASLESRDEVLNISLASSLAISVFKFSQVMQLPGPDSQVSLDPLDSPDF